MKWLNVHSPVLKSNKQKGVIGNLKELVEEGKFREDLYYQLNVVSIEIPPLRQRPEDIIELTYYFLFEISTRYNRPIHGISQEVM